MDMTTTPCPTCAHPTIGHTAWRTLPKPRAARPRVRGVCRNCDRTGGPSATSTPVPREDVLEDWTWLHETGELSEVDSLSHRVRMAAPRMSMTPQALERALQRAGIRQPVPDTIPLAVRKPGTFSDCVECRKGAHHVDVWEAEVRRLAKRLSADPDSVRSRHELDSARDNLADAEAWRDMHVDEHTETEVAA